MSRINFGIHEKALLTVVPALAPLYLTRHRISFGPDTGKAESTLPITVPIL